ncbi:MAG: hypothetical protein KKG47_09920 [Proteobacteria bacterium]|nr:hypothetical protein [Pseudomonadota bacterium]MBU1736590.1 hypothetical protein [Pseudomonadota bacterium]
MAKNNDGHNLKLQEVKTLVEHCPHGHNLLNLDCPVRNIRKLNADNLSKALGQMSPAEINAIIDYHKSCSGRDSSPQIH